MRNFFKLLSFKIVIYGTSVLYEFNSYVGTTKYPKKRKL